jgi:hypothetical protein
MVDGDLLVNAEHGAGLLMRDKLALDPEPIFGNFLPTVIVDLLIPDPSPLLTQIPLHFVPPLKITDEPTWSKIMLCNTS